MTISSLQYKAHELRVHTHQGFPFQRDPYVSGARRFSAVVAIDTVLPSDEAVHRCKTTVLLTPQEIDEAVNKTGTHRPPGLEIDQAEVGKWDSEGGHLSQEKR